MPAAKYLFPGGVDVHTHVDFTLLGREGVEDFYSGTSAAACGGVTTIIDYALPEPGQTIQANIEAWQKKAKTKAVIDYGFHPAIFEPTDKLIDEMADAVADGYPASSCSCLDSPVSMNRPPSTSRRLRARRQTGSDNQHPLRGQLPVQFPQLKVHR